MRQDHPPGVCPVPEVHLPHLEDEDEPGPKQPVTAETARSATAPVVKPPHRSRSFVKIGLEVLLISAGVFLGLMGEQWREHAHHRELAESSLRRFRMELQGNRNAVAAVKDKHVAKLQSLRAYLTLDAAARQKVVNFDDATDPAFLEYSAWDLALATQSLAYIDSDLAFAISHVYAAQQQLDGSTRGVTQAMYATGNPEAFLRNGLATYFGDCILMEPRLLKTYDEVLPQIDRALGESPAGSPGEQPGK
jgi:hypothetical protein